MGLLRRLSEGKRIKDGIRGEAIVLAINPPTEGARRYQMEGELLVEIPGRPPYRTTAGLYVPESKWPMPGARVPVTTDRSAPERVQVAWEELPARSKEEMQRDLDEELAAGRIRPRAEEFPKGRFDELHRLFDNTSMSDGSGLYLIELTNPPSKVDS